MREPKRDFRRKKGNSRGKIVALWENDGFGEKNDGFWEKSDDFKWRNDNY